MADESAHSPTPDSPGADGAHEDHGHPEFLAHHFDTPVHQYSSGKLGMWIFLATEILMFGGLFCAFAVYSANHPQMFQDGHQLLDKKWGAINTVILLLSSFTMAWAVNAAQLNQRRLCVGLLTLTLLGGFGFMGIKYIEYSHKFDMGVGPGRFFDEERILSDDRWLPGHAEADDAHTDAPADAAHAAPATLSRQDRALQRVRTQAADVAIGPRGPAPHAAAQDGSGHGGGHGEGGHFPPLTAEQVIGARNFVNIYFGMTGLHGLHVLIGMALILWILIRSARGAFSSAYYTPVDLVGLYWHLVDLIWIFLFPLLYLVT